MVAAVTTRGLTKNYHRRVALSGVDLDIPAGTVFGYLGPNGAGKTTTIRLLVGLIRPTAGHASVFGLDVVKDREAVQQKIGYLPGEFVAYHDLTCRQYLRYLGNLRNGQRGSAMEQLADRLGLDLSDRIGALSHGNRQKVGIVQAFMHQPDILVLDEPTSGLDPLVQREFLALLREARQNGQTVFLSSHVLSEVEAVADTVGIIHRGRLMVVESVAVLKQKALRRMDLTFAQPPPVARLGEIGCVRDMRTDGHTVHLLIEGSPADLLQVAAPYRITQIVTHEPDLEQIFMSYYRQGGPSDAR